MPRVIPALRLTMGALTLLILAAWLSSCFSLRGPDQREINRQIEADRKLKERYDHPICLRCDHDPCICNQDPEEDYDLGAQYP